MPTESSSSSRYDGDTTGTVEPRADMTDVTRILNAIGQGDARAADQLFPLIYAELRQLAAHKMAREGVNQTLQPTALVHEAWLRLVGTENPSWESRAHFFAAAAEAMETRRERIVATLNHLEERGDMTLKVAGVRRGYRFVRRPESPNDLIRELNRQGQVFFLHNRVKTIDKKAWEIRKLVSDSEARVGVAHGRMAKSELEKVMIDFVMYENVLFINRDCRIFSFVCILIDVILRFFLPA